MQFQNSENVHNPRLCGTYSRNHVESKFEYGIVCMRVHKKYWRSGLKRVCKKYIFPVFIHTVLRGVSSKLPQPMGLHD